MDAVEFMKAEKRFLQECEDSNKYFDLKLQFHQFEECVALVKQWSKEHPVNTYKSEFLKLFPNAILRNNGYPEYGLYLLTNKQEHVGSLECWDAEFKGWS